MKKCSRCKILKNESEFGKDSTRKSGLHPYCLECRQKEYLGRKEKIRNYQRLLEFGVNNDWYNKKFIEQKGCCAICRKHQSEFKKGLAIDHNHATGQVRGLLCNNCNNGIGRFAEDIQVLRNAIEYLEYFKNLA